MDARRDLVPLISEFGKVLKLNILKPVVEEGESSVKSEFSAVLDIASGKEVAVPPFSDVLSDTDELSIIPTSFITLFLMIMKYCVIFADDGKMDGYVLIYLIHAGSEGVSNTLTPKLSHSELMARKEKKWQ